MDMNDLNGFAGSFNNPLQSTHKCGNCNKEFKNDDQLTTFIEVETISKGKSDDILVWDAFAYVYGISWEEFRNFKRQRTESGLVDSQIFTAASSIEVCQFCVSLLVENYNAHLKFENSTHFLSIFQEIKEGCGKILHKTWLPVPGATLSDFSDATQPSPMELGREQDYSYPDVDDEQHSISSKIQTFTDYIKEEPIDNIYELEENHFDLENQAFQVQHGSEPSKCVKTESNRKLAIKLEKLSDESLQVNNKRNCNLKKDLNKNEKLKDQSNSVKVGDFGINTTENGTREQENQKYNSQVDAIWNGEFNSYKSKDDRSKFLRNSGLEYMNRAGKLFPALKHCSGEKVCYRKCRKLGCSLTQERINSCREFWTPGTDNYSRQNQILLPLIHWSDPQKRTVDEKTSRRKASYRYYLENSEGVRIECCLPTFLDTFRITASRLKGVKDKIRQGVDVGDKRGKHKNRPHKYPIENHLLVKEHINSFPVESIDCCTTENPKRKYLQCDLNASKMFRLFLAKHGDGYEHMEKLYKDTFRATGLRFCPSKCDGCNKSLLSP